jgi:hypothetical protein
MMQLITVILAILGFAYNGYKDYTSGNLRVLTNSNNGVKTNYPVQYCLMVYDPNIDKVYYQHEDGKFYDYPPQQRRYEATPQRGQGQESYALGNMSRASGTQVYGVRQSPQATAYTQGY